ncbi:MAG: carboxypeptidase-like regulatory domain-containing protein, partial [Bacteroidales bacterium]|nr:carboxypeptidase-like regulatory domain-containing protein [Bacteroidales bacterium]
MKRFILTLCLGFCLLSLKAQQIQLKGILVDETTQSPIANAIIKIEDKTISTDSEGFFSLSELKPGRLGLWIEATGYEPYSMVVIF